MLKVTDRADQAFAPWDNYIHLADFVKCTVELEIVKVTAPHGQLATVLTAQGPISLTAFQKSFPDRAVFC